MLTFDVAVGINIEARVRAIFRRAEDPNVADNAEVAAKLVHELTADPNQLFPNLAAKIKEAGSTTKVVECMENFKVAHTYTYPTKVLDEILNARFQLRKLPFEFSTAESDTEGSDTEQSETKGSETKGSETKGSETKESETEESETEEAKTRGKDINRFFSTPSESWHDVHAKLDALTVQGEEEIYPEFVDKLTQANLLLTLQTMEFQSDPNGAYAMEQARFQRIMAILYQ
ncbi:hypothetical protein BDY17DRAFT_140363 [Neohortaea acidophila]|uniref:Uncharacterized protein n=1 Tax=Neohortaea acidophila TaxID=245834 RepID=A0A6A6PT45_9PEZI|nr:uncharacterized protein BDY17DRAFT_140363 [Neohortaea acidophila]KAF2483055.1 hypothetical protein BDY17DRAFT_140363 [Neohortaea acidophila]